MSTSLKPHAPPLKPPLAPQEWQAAGQRAHAHHARRSLHWMCMQASIITLATCMHVHAGMRTLKGLAGNNIFGCIGLHAFLELCLNRRHSLPSVLAARVVIAGEQNGP
eukprot:361921-Chlamydomonas_euryale.AAC.14